MTSGAIQNGVPITVWRLLRVLESCVETPKSAAAATRGGDSCDASGEWGSGRRWRTQLGASLLGQQDVSGLDILHDQAGSEGSKAGALAAGAGGVSAGANPVDQVLAVEVVQPPQHRGAGGGNLLLRQGVLCDAEQIARGAGAAVLHDNLLRGGMVGTGAAATACSGGDGGARAAPIVRCS